MTPIFYIYQPFVGSVGSHPCWHWSFSFCPVSCGGEGAVCRGRGEAGCPQPHRASPGIAGFLAQGRLAAALGRLLCQKARRCVTYIAYIKHYCHTMPHTNRVSFISLATADWSSFIFRRSPVKYISIKVLQEAGFLRGHGSLSSLCSAALPSALGFAFVPGTAAFQLCSVCSSRGCGDACTARTPRFPTLPKPPISPRAEAAASQPH